MKSELKLMLHMILIITLLATIIGIIFILSGCGDSPDPIYDVPDMEGAYEYVGAAPSIPADNIDIDRQYWTGVDAEQDGAYVEITVTAEYQGYHYAYTVRKFVGTEYVERQESYEEGEEIPQYTWSVTPAPALRRHIGNSHGDQRIRGVFQRLGAVDQTPVDDPIEPETPVDDPIIDDSTEEETTNPVDPPVVNPTPTPTPTPVNPIYRPPPPPVFGSLNIISVSHTGNDDVMVSWEGSGKENALYRVTCTNGFDRTTTYATSHEGNMYSKSVHSVPFELWQNYTITITDSDTDKSDSVTFMFGDHQHPGDFWGDEFEEVYADNWHIHANSMGGRHKHNRVNSILDGNGNTTKPE